MTWSPNEWAWALAAEFGHSNESVAGWIAEIRDVKVEGEPVAWLAGQLKTFTDTERAQLLKLIRDNVPTDYLSRERKWSQLQARLQADPFLKAQRDGWGS
jgi:hypothetical protein